MGTLKNWEKSNKSLDEFLGEEPCRIDESLYMYIIEIVHARFSIHGHGQLGECEREENGIRYYMTVREVDGKYWYLGVLPAYQND